MRRLTWAALAALGLSVGAYSERGEARPAASSATEGQGTRAPDERERAEARRRLRERANELADAASRTARAASEVAKQEAQELNARVKQEAPKVHEDLSRAAEDVSQRARELARDLGAEGSSEAGPGVRTGSVSGTVARTSKGELQVREAGGRRLVLSLDDQTRVVREGEPVGLKALQPGTEVHVSYVVEGDDWVARRVDVAPPAKK